VKVFRAETLHAAAYEEIVSLLRRGGIIAFPTDTAYGLGADPFNETAVNRIFEIKGRPETKPILLVVDSPAMAESVCRPSAVFYDVVRRFWPGAVTAIVQAAATVPENVTAGTKTIGLRWPIAPFATTLVNRYGQPITGTSANRSGRPATVTAEEVREELGDAVDALIDGGVLPARGGSTILDLTVDPPVLLREGPISFAVLEEFFNGRIRRQVA
jgi:L-threonylcarbamoyladenylate synthase